MSEGLAWRSGGGLAFAGLGVSLLAVSGSPSGIAAVWVGALGVGCVLLLAAALWTISSNRALRRQLSDARRRYDDALDSMAEGFALFGPDERLVYRNRRYVECFPRTGWLRVPGVRMSALRAAAIKHGEFKGVDSSNGAAWIAAQQAIFEAGGRTEYELADGRHMVAVTRPTPDGGRVVVWHDVTERKQLERELEHRATHDTLTGLPNRAMFRDELRRARARAERDGSELAVMLLDLDHFKEANDTHGHAVGDALLVEVARRLDAAVRAGDFVARLGGDEFAILAAWPAGTSKVERLAHRVLRRLAEPVHLGGGILRPGGSIGFALYPADPGGADLLLEHADQALYRAKRSGRGTWAGGGVEWAGPIRAGVSADRFVAAVERGELDVDYQPILRLDTLDLVGVEALVRWNHPELGRLPARAFMPVAERSRAIHALTRHVMTLSLARQRSWLADGVGDLRVWVNLAPRCIAWDGLVDMVGVLLAETGVPARRLVLELTESTIAGERAAEVRLAGLRRLGVAIAVDDFGAGQSSLGRLKALPLDILKIDRAFVAAVASDERDRGMVRTITALSANLKLTATAEGIETMEQLQALRELGCDLVQGYLFARPMPADQLGAWIAAWHGERRAAFRPACAESPGNMLGRPRSVA